MWFATVLALLGVGGGGLFVASLLDLIKGSHHMMDDRVGLAAPSSIFLFLFAQIKLSTWSAKRDQRFILNALKNALSAEITRTPD